MMRRSLVVLLVPAALVAAACGQKAGVAGSGQPVAPPATVAPPGPTAPPTGSTEPAHAP